MGRNGAFKTTRTSPYHRSSLAIIVEAVPAMTQVFQGIDQGASSRTPPKTMLGLDMKYFESENYVVHNSKRSINLGYV
jgi:hypothetical protein